MMFEVTFTHARRYSIHIEADTPEDAERKVVLGIYDEADTVLLESDGRRVEIVRVP